MEKLGVRQLIGEQATLALIVNDTNLSKKGQDGFQFWALDDITRDGVTFKKGEFAIRAKNGDFFTVDPVDGVSFKVSKMEITALGSNVYGDFTVFDEKNGKAQLFLDLLDSGGGVLAAPAITIGNTGKKPTITINGSPTNVTGPLTVGPTGGSYVRVNDGMIELYQGGVMKAQMKLAAVAGVLSLLVSGLPLACEGLTSSGDIKGSTVDSGWTGVDLNTFYSKNMYGIAYGGGKFVTMGSDGVMAYSADGISWTRVENTTLTGIPIRAITYGGSKFVAVGEGGKAAYSTDGVNWTAVGDTKFGDSVIRAIAYGGGKFVAVGYDGKAAYSSDGITWTAVSNTTFGSNNIIAIAYGAGKWVAAGVGGRSAYSTDGINWTSVNLFNAINLGNEPVGIIYGIAYGGPPGEEKFVMVDDRAASLYSTDGINWYWDDVFLGVNILWGVAYGGGKFVAVGEGGRAAYSLMANQQAKLMFKPDGSLRWVKG